MYLYILFVSCLRCKVGRGMNASSHIEMINSNYNNNYISLSF